MTNEASTKQTTDPTISPNGQHDKTAMGQHDKRNGLVSSTDGQHDGPGTGDGQHDGTGTDGQHDSTPVDSPEN